MANTGTVGTAGNGAGVAPTGGAGSSSGGTGQPAGTRGGSSAANQGSAASAAHAAAPNVNGRGLLAALLHPIVTGASQAGGTGVWLPIFLGLAFMLTLGGVLIRRRRLAAARRRFTG